MKEFTHALAIKLINSIKMKQVKRLLYVLFSLFLFLGMFTTIIVKAHSGDVLSAWAEVIPTIDGILSSGEWDDADFVTFALSWGVENHDVTLYIMNDFDNLYVAVEILGEDLDDNDILNLYFDNDHDGSYDFGDNRLGMGFPTENWGWGEFYTDNYLYERMGSNWDTHDEENPGTIDGIGRFTHTNMGTYDVDGDYFFEFSYPLDSDDDLHDFSLSIGDTVGFYLKYYDDLEYSDYWPISNQWSEMADILIASTPGTEPTPPPNKKPIAYAGPDQTAYIGETVDFSGAGSYDSDGTIVSYEWDFGDGKTDSGVEVSHSYEETGFYTVTLTVMDNKGAKDTETCVVTVTRARAEPEPEPPEPPFDLTQVILALISLVGIFITAYFGYLALSARSQKT